MRNGPVFATPAALALGEVCPEIRWGEGLAQRGSVPCRLLPATLTSGRAVYDWRPGLFPGVVVLAALILEAAAVRVPILGRGWAGFDPAVTPIELLPELKAYEKASPPATPIFNDMLYIGFLI